MAKVAIPQAIFPPLAQLVQQNALPSALVATLEQDPYVSTDYALAREFLLAYQKNSETYRTYRSEVERLLQWSWLVKQQSVLVHKRKDIEELIAFCSHPPLAWIGARAVPRFLKTAGGGLQPNPRWRPFVNNLAAGSKRLRVRRCSSRSGAADLTSYQLSEAGLSVMLAVWGSFYNYLILEEHTTVNPVLLIKQKNALIHRHQQQRPIRRLSNQQIAYLMRAAELLAQENPHKHCRTLFIIEALFGMYLRISELTARLHWTPQMNHFFQDSEGDWWFKVLGKGNKERDISVSDAMLAALRGYRVSLGLPPLPSRADNQPLLPKLTGRGGLTNTRHIRIIVQYCFDRAFELMRQEGLAEQAQELRIATVHWLRHTGISEDVKIRPREHVRDDAGHSSSAITDRYIDVQQHERHASARAKPLIPKVEE